MTFDMCLACPHCILLDSEDGDQQDMDDLYFQKNSRVIMTFCVSQITLPKDSFDFFFMNISEY